MNDQDINKLAVAIVAALGAALAGQAIPPEASEESAPKPKAKPKPKPEPKPEPEPEETNTEPETEAENEFQFASAEALSDQVQADMADGKFERGSIVQALQELGVKNFKDLSKPGFGPEDWQSVYNRIFELDANGGE